MQLADVFNWDTNGVESIAWAPGQETINTACAFWVYNPADRISSYSSHVQVHYLINKKQAALQFDPFSKSMIVNQDMYRTRWYGGT